jgi:hypothetical protein
MVGLQPSIFSSSSLSDLANGHFGLLASVIYLHSHLIFELIEAVLSIIAGVWAALAVVSQLRFRRLFAFPSPNQTLNAVAYTTNEAAQRAASDRRERIIAFMSENDDRRRARREFLEAPPTLADQAIREFEDTDDASYWHLSRLRFQLVNDRDLLVERLIDALTCLYRSALLNEKDFPVSVRVAPIDQQKKQATQFISVASFNLYRQHSSPASSILAIRSGTLAGHRGRSHSGGLWRERRYRSRTGDASFRS